VDGLAGGKHARVERMEWTVISDSATAASAMTQSEQDYWEYPLHDLLPVLRRSRQVVVEQRLAEGTYGCLRFNHLHPPFDNPAIRRAVAMAVDQRDHLRAVAGEDSRRLGPCEASSIAAARWRTSENSDILRTAASTAPAPRCAEAGYNRRARGGHHALRLSADQRARPRHRDLLAASA
jgi:peptide/nickel transport system substrate-binding protein